MIHAAGLFKIPLNLIQRRESGFVLSCKSAITYLYTGFVWQRKQAIKDNKTWIPISFQDDLFSLVIAQPLKESWKLQTRQIKFKISFYLTMKAHLLTRLDSDPSEHGTTHLIYKFYMT